jgi:hypothetical protein
LIATTLFFATPILAQQLTLGAEGGFRLTGDTPPDAPIFAASNSRSYLVGPGIELGLPFHFSSEVEALYSRLGNTEYVPGIGNAFNVRTIANSWTFSVLVKYHLPIPLVHPFVSFGIAPRHAGGSIDTIHYGYYASDVTFSSTNWSAHDHAWVLGGGAEIRLGRISITSELRYLRWDDSSNFYPSNVAFYLTVPQNDQVLLGIGWRVR